MALKLRCIEFCELLRVHFFTFLLNLVAIFVQLRFFLLWFGRRYVEDALGGFEADRVTVKDITAILAVVLAESPPDSFVDQVSRNLILRVLLGEVVDFDFDVKNFKALGILGMLELVQLVQVVKLLLKLVASINNFFAFSPYRAFFLMSSSSSEKTGGLVSSTYASESQSSSASLFASSRLFFFSCSYSLSFSSRYRRFASFACLARSVSLIFSALRRL